MEILLSITSKKDGNVREVTRSIGDGLVIGRGAEEGILLEGVDLSREHLVLTEEGSTVYVTDLSVNGTWLNGKQLKRSVKTRVQPEDAIEIPGYVLSFRFQEQPDDTDAVVVQLPQALPEIEPTQAVIAQKAGPSTMLQPVFKFIGSFTLMEKLLFVVALGGLLLLYTYIS